VSTLKQQLEVNLYGVWNGLQAFVPAMRGKEGAICATSSWFPARWIAPCANEGCCGCRSGLINTSTVGTGGGAAYTISKHAVRGPSRCGLSALHSSPSLCIHCWYCWAAR